VPGAADLEHGAGTPRGLGAPGVGGAAAIGGRRRPGSAREGRLSDVDKVRARATKMSRPELIGAVVMTSNHRHWN
jgi:hypothetical protein